MKKIIIRSKGEFEIDVNQKVFGMDLATGEVSLSFLVHKETNDKGMDVYSFEEKDNHIYLPCNNLKQAIQKFKMVVR